MKSIYKYPITITDTQTVDMPLGAQILCCQVQHGMPCLWALVDKQEAIIVNRVIHILGTGHNADRIDEDMRYLSTIQMEGGALVFHVFVEFENYDI